MELPIEWGAAGALLSVIIIDVVMAGDNAVVVGMAAATLPEHLRRRMIFLGIVTATVMRIALASVASQLLEIIGLTLAGGVLLLWVAWKFYSELRAVQARKGRRRAIRHPPNLTSAVLRIAFADLSMSLDNVLAIAGTARSHFWVLVTGLLLSVALMGSVSHLVARMLHRYHWIAWLGLAIVTFVALKMIYEGSIEVIDHAAVQAVLAWVEPGLSRNWVL
jgi:YjbE family integral membrane protein